jgi:hypothetical protein
MRLTAQDTGCSRLPIHKRAYGDMELQVEAPDQLNFVRERGIRVTVKS